MRRRRRFESEQRAAAFNHQWQRQRQYRGREIDSTSPLAAVGGAAMVRSSGGSFLVSRTAQETLAALTSTCTHEACTITGFDNTNYVCPCHGSKFTTAGRVINGPANAPLRMFATQFSNNVLTISI
jgi:cytochrome b6-f complex iron-sulfur subunit